MAEALGEDIARHKRAHLADVYAPGPRLRRVQCPRHPKGISSLNLDSDPLGAQFLNASADALRVTAV